MLSLGRLRRQAAQLDRYCAMLRRDRNALAPPELESELARVARAVARDIDRPVAPAAFRADLWTRIEAQSTAGSEPRIWSRPAVQPKRYPSSADETEDISTMPASTGQPVSLKRRRWSTELWKVAAAFAAFVVVGALLVLLLRDGDEPTVAAPGSPTTLASPAAASTDTIDPTRAAAISKLTATAEVEASNATATAVTFATANAGLPSPGDVVKTIDLVNGPGALVALDGSIWAAELFGPSVIRIDSTRETQVASIKVGNGEVPWIVAYDGQIWAATSDDTIVRIDPATNDVAQTIAFDTAVRDDPYQPSGFFVDQSGIWISDFVLGRVVNIDPANGAVLGELTLEQPGFITAAFGTIWVVTNDGTSIARIDPASHQVTNAIAVDGAFTLAATSDAMWVSGGKQSLATGTGSSSVKRIDPTTNAVVESIDTGMASPEFICATPSGIWVASYFQEGIAKIDLMTKQPSRIIDIDSGNGGGIIELDGSIWAARFYTAKVVRITPAP